MKTLLAVFVLFAGLLGASEVRQGKFDTASFSGTVLVIDWAQLGIPGTTVPFGIQVWTRAKNPAAKAILCTLTVLVNGQVQVLLQRQTTFSDYITLFGFGFQTRPEKIFDITLEEITQTNSLLVEEYQ